MSDRFTHEEFNDRYTHAELESILIVLHRIARTLEALFCHQQLGTLGLAVSSVTGRRIPMSTVTPLELVDVEKDLLSIAPKDEAGQPVTAGPYSWTVDDSTIVTLQPAADGLSCEVITGAPGVCNVSVTDGVLTDTIQITVKVGAESSLNLSAGTPVHK
jgi:hypothetical protein